MRTVRSLGRRGLNVSGSGGAMGAAPGNVLVRATLVDPEPLFKDMFDPSWASLEPMC
ncbi:hypothetical protein GCM10007073_06920 [Micrococcus flavus]|nr:hypothetical protein GCM10007073_06920 [Micrococcus flavus]